MMIEKKVFEDLISKLDKQEKDIEQKNSSIAILENQIKLAQQDVEVLKKEKKKLTDEIISLSAFPELVKNIVFGKGWWWTKLVRVKALFNVNI
jgi:chromosome segregation ATPase